MRLDFDSFLMLFGCFQIGFWLYVRKSVLGMFSFRVSRLFVIVMKIYSSFSVICVLCRETPSVRFFFLFAFSVSGLFVLCDVNLLQLFCDLCCVL